ncbi:hypothetical protein FIV42_25930 [Persicimonas caeni]|uniref:POTRA domain-containing protein n=1 Tax=Persicimonas caeni TaxID=2292766 RepID=A0A4Y6Q0F2_PERCE|nr:BamA/TamA family outer membrane protein [Persicimonas caeni]QDG54056.1 hypothetical protein FIV42_25930 [Persicimonas caeni]QED35277.1 BamA/TamA family outer membrane protein [Persicimonas caeni]
MVTTGPKPYRPLLRRLLLAACALLLVTSCAGDEAAKRDMVVPGRTQLRVASFEITGTEQFDADTIKDGLATQEDAGWRTSISWMPLLGAEPQYFNRIQWRRDLERIRTFYKMRGYFNARIVSENIIESREKGAVRISIRIAEGQPTRVKDLEIEGLEPLNVKARKQVLKSLPLDEGDVFTQETYLTTRKELVDRLRQRSYAYAEISGRAVVNPQTNEAQVFYFLDPGPRAKFGKIYIIGNDEIDAEYVRNTIEIEPGEAYSGEQLEDAQQDIYDMGVFSLVSVLPAHQASGEVLEQAGVTREELEGLDVLGEDEDEEPPEKVYPDIPDDTREGPQQVEEPLEQVGPEVEEDIEEIQEAEAEVPGPLGISDVLASAQEQAESRVALEQSVPIIIRLKEARMWNVELGAGVSIETNRAAVQGQANWSSRNFLGGLRRLEHFNSLGYAWASNTGDVTTAAGPLLFGGRQSEADNEGIFVDSRLEFRQPQFLEPKTTLRATARLRRAIEVGYTVWNPQGTLGIERRFFDDLTIGLNYHLAYYKYSNVGSALLTAPQLGVDFEDEYFLEWLEPRIALDLRDSPINPQAGYFTALSIQNAGSYLLGGDFKFVKVQWGNEGYVPFDLFTRWVLAGRFRVGAIYNREPVEGEAEDTDRVEPVPIENRLYAGGANSLRGLGRNNLSLFRVGAFDPSRPRDIETVEVIPIGGLTLLEASLEPRFRLFKNLADIGPLWGVVFYDVATVVNDQLFYSTPASDALGTQTTDFGDLTSTLITSAGGGFFWLTPVGPVRADFALTLNDLSNDPRFRTCGPASRVQNEVTQTGISDCEFLPVERDPVQQQLNLDYSFFIGIGHSF